MEYATLSNYQGLPVLGAWMPSASAPLFSPAEWAQAVGQFRQPLHILQHPASQTVGVALDGHVLPGQWAAEGQLHWLASLPALYPEWLGDRAFLLQHRLRFPYLAGAMANGLTTVKMVLAMAHAGMMGFFGAAGLSYARVEQAIAEIKAGLAHPDLAWGINLIHSPHEPQLENRLAELYIREGVTKVEASAYMNLTPAIVHYACSGLWVDAEGRIQRRHQVFAKVSRPEVAQKFMSPAPATMLKALVTAGKLTPQEAELASQVAIAEQVTAEADSGGHTDNRPLVVLFPVLTALRDSLMAKYQYRRPIVIGAAGGLGSPSAVAAAFAMGAAYVLTGSVNQGAVESGLAPDGRELLAQAGMADVAMAAAADMFELGVKLQVLQRGSLFASRANRLYDIYRQYPGLENLPKDVLAELENKLLGANINEIWQDVCTFWEQRDPQQITKATADPKHRMALIFRWYLGKSSRWAIAGEQARRADYQIWCGPAMGAFNTWVKGSFLEPTTQRSVVQIALNMLEGAAFMTRAQQLRCYGIPVPATAFHFQPRPLS